MTTPTSTHRGRLATLLVGCTMALPACGAQDEVTDEERLRIVAEFEGFDVSDAEYDGENLYVDDIAFTPDHLPQYEAIVSDDQQFRAFLKNQNSKVIDLGFRSICFRIDDSGANSAEDWIGTFNTLTTSLNSLGTTLSFVNRRQSVGCPAGREVIKVTTKNFSGNTIGRAEYPEQNIFNGNTHPGDWIKLERSINPTLRLAAHELMHTLGVAHIDDPNTGNLDWVAGTCASGAVCGGQTVMFSAVPQDQVGLLSDDIAALQIVY